MTELLDRISAALVGLKMPRALEALDPAVQRLERGEPAALEAIDALLGEEFALRETRRNDVALRTAKLVPVKTIESFDFAFQPSLDRERIAALAELDFIRRRETVHFLGPPGTGKSHLATALGVAAVKAGKSVYRTTLAELTDSLATAERQGRLAEKTQIQALDRTQKGLPMKPGWPATMTHDYKRNGTTTLFAALNTLDGTVIGRHAERHRHLEFIEFLDQIEAEVPDGRPIHAILDNYAAHKHGAVREWLAEHPLHADLLLLDERG